MKCKSGFVMRDAIFGIASLSVLGALALPVLSQVRMDSSRQACIGNYRFTSQATGSYINDNAGKMWALSWKAGMVNPYMPTTQYFASDSEAQAYQMAGIVRRLTNLTAAETPVPQNWFPQILNAHIALLDYINQPIPANFMVCPEDRTRQEYLEGDYSNLPANGGDGSSTTWRWVVSSTYQWDVFQWSPSRAYQAPTFSGQMQWAAMPFHITSDTSLWSVDGSISPPGIWGPRPASDVRFPSQKVFLSDDYARHNGQTRYYADQDAGQDLLFHDGSVRYFRPDSTNPGWSPQNKANRGNMTRRFAFTKKADLFGSLANGVKSANYTAGWYRWTRGGLNGWDTPRLRSMIGKLPSPGVVENELNTSTGIW